MRPPLASATYDDAAGNELLLAEIVLRLSSRPVDTARYPLEGIICSIQKQLLTQ